MCIRTVFFQLNVQTKNIKFYISLNIHHVTSYSVSKQNATFRGWLAKSYVANTNIKSDSCNFNMLKIKIMALRFWSFNSLKLTRASPWVWRCEGPWWPSPPGWWLTPPWWGTSRGWKCAVGHCKDPKLILAPNALGQKVLVLLQ